MIDHADIVKRALSWCEEGEMGNRHREAGLAALDALVAERAEAKKSYWTLFHDFGAATGKNQGIIDGLLVRAEDAEAERDELRERLTRAGDSARETIKDALLLKEAAEAENARLNTKIEKLEMQVHQYNRRVGWPRYPLKGE